MVHTTLTAETNTVSITIPGDYIGKVIEVIAFSKDEGIGGQISQPKKVVKFDAISFNTKDLKFNRDEANER